MNARKALLVVTAPALVAGIVGMSASQAVASTTALTASLSGANESGGAGDPKASGSVSLTVDTTSGQVCATVTSGITGAVAMHIHKGAAGANGPVVVPLDAKKINGGASCATAAATLAGQIAADPASYYFNVHTPAFPAGAIRGQLAVQPSSVAAGSGGQAGTGSGPDPVLLIVVVAGAAVVGAAGWRLARR
jgi:hypothetical protein